MLIRGECWIEIGVGMLFQIDAGHGWGGIRKFCVRCGQTSIPGKESDGI